MHKDGRKTQSAKAGNRTPHDTGNRSRPSTAGCIPSNTGNWTRAMSVEDTGTPPDTGNWTRGVSVEDTGTPSNTENWTRGVSVEDTGTPPDIPPDDMKFDKQSIKVWITKVVLKSAYKQVELEINDKKYYSTSPASAARAEETPESAEQTQATIGDEKRAVTTEQTTKTEGKTRMLAYEKAANKKLLNIPRNPSFDLLEGFKKIENGHKGEKLDIVVEKLMQLQWTNGTAGQTQFVCKAGLLKEVGLTPHKYDDKSLEIVVENLGNNYFMHLDVSDRVFHGSKSFYDKNRYMGLKFEQLVTKTAEEAGEGGSNQSVNREYEYNVMVRAKLGQHNLIIAGEIDCFDEQGQAVELKTNAKSFSSVYHTKCIEWWLQCYLLGVESIALGIKKDEKCREVERHTVKPQGLRYLVDQYPYSDSKVCIAALDKFLTRVKENVQEEESKILLFERKICETPQESPKFTWRKSNNEFIKGDLRKRLIKTLTPTRPSSAASASKTA